ncbi:MAG: prepilin-type N-terminal cleavage/methylation domain-containing protein [Terrimicrobiaceae bacterium]
MKKPSGKLSVQSAFSLVELLVVIAVIAVIAAIAIPNISGITQGATDAKDHRNAQQLASIASACVAAGDTNAAARTSVTLWTTALTNGITVINPSGGTNGVFKVDGLGSNEVTRASRFLTNDANNNLVYRP